jgi:hypothetical protein
MACPFSHAQFLALLIRERNKIPACITAAVVRTICTPLTLDKQKMAGFVDAVGVPVAGCSALMASADDVRGDSLAHPFIKYKVFTDEL